MIAQRLQIYHTFSFSGITLTLMQIYEQRLSHQRRLITNQKLLSVGELTTQVTCFFNGNDFWIDLLRTAVGIWTTLVTIIKTSPASRIAAFISAFPNQKDF